MDSLNEVLRRKHHANHFWKPQMRRASTKFMSITVLEFVLSPITWVAYHHFVSIFQCICIQSGGCWNRRTSVSSPTNNEHKDSHIVRTRICLPCSPTDAMYNVNSVFFSISQCHCQCNKFAVLQDEESLNLEHHNFKSNLFLLELCNNLQVQPHLVNSLSNNLCISWTISPSVIHMGCGCLRFVNALDL